MSETASTNPQQNVTFPSNGDTAHGYLALPPNGSGPGVVVIQEWWGLTSHIGSIADRLAGEGFVALAPDLYGGPTTHDADEAMQLMQQLPVDRAARDLAGAVDYLLGRPESTGTQVGAIGFCMGGAFVLTLAAQQGDRIGAAVACYPASAETPDLSGLSAALQLHLADQDEFLPPAAAAGLADRLGAQGSGSVEVHHYDAGHAFINDENLIGTYDAQAADLAWDRAVAFLKEHLR
ncbi:MAG TPA: dienelactone hydrolase family protein [Acidimicrobiales bacterium]|nr:dienelactone hydrolase family protein [Acidimicrobiales bacterium]